MVVQESENLTQNFRHQILTGDKKPYTATPNYPGFPADLKKTPRWMPWRYQNKDGKWSKIPIDPSNPTKWGSHANTAQWMPFLEAMKMVSGSSGSLDGLKFVPGEDYVILDLDNALNPDKSPKPTVLKVLQAANTYTDISPTGTGLKLVFGVPYATLLQRAELHGITRLESLVHKVDVPQEGWDCEVLWATKAACLTGYSPAGFEAEVNADPEAFFDAWELLYEETIDRALENEKRGAMAGEPLKITSGSMSLEEIISKAKSISPKFKALFNGDMSAYGEDHSRADMGLYSMLAWFIGPDVGRIREAFERSALYREGKKDKYHELTLSRALEDLKEVFDWTKTSDSERKFDLWAEELGARGGDGEDVGARGEEDLRQAAPIEVEEPEPAEGPTAEQAEEAERQAFLSILTGRTIEAKVADIPGEKNGYRYLVEKCPCCREPGVFTVQRRNGKREYHCGNSQGISWGMAYMKWTGLKMQRRAYTISELVALPISRYLIEGIIPEKSLVMLYGPSGSLKTFVSIDMAMSIACGRPWQGYETQARPVVYIIGEGQGEFLKRLMAWKIQNDINEEVPIIVLPQPFHLTNGDTEVAEIERLVKERLGDQKPGLIVVDTLNRNFGAADENSTSDMTRFVAALDLLRETFEAAVAVVHHSNREGTRERSNVVLRNSCDVILAADHEIHDTHVKLKCSKVKDAAPFGEIRLRKVQVDTPRGSSLALSRDDTPVSDGKSTRSDYALVEEKVLAYVPTSKEKAMGKGKIVSEVQGGMQAARCSEKDIPGENAIRKALVALVKNNVVREIEAKNKNNNTYWRDVNHGGSGFPIPLDAEFFPEN